MAKTAEVETVIRTSIETVIKHGAILVHGEYGVIWDSNEKCWTWDREMFSQSPHCDCVGAFMIAKQPEVDPELHKGDIFDAAIFALKLERFWLGDLLNGFDDLRYQGDGFPDVYGLGVRLRQEYRAANFNYLALNRCPGIHVSDRYRQYILDYCIVNPWVLKETPAAIPSAPALPTAPISSPKLPEPRSGVHRTVPAVPQEHVAAI